MSQSLPDLPELPDDEIPAPESDVPGATAEPLEPSVTNPDADGLDDVVS